MVNFDKFSSKNTVIFDDFSPKITIVRPKYVSRGSIQEGVLLTRIRYFIPKSKDNFEAIFIMSKNMGGFKNTAFSDENLTKLTIVCGLKFQKINRTPGLH